MFIKRLFPNRWAKILAWTGASLTWASVAVAAAGRGDVTAEQAQTVADTPDPPATATPTTTVASIPVPPEQGLVIIRYQPVAPPAPEVIVRNVSVPSKSVAKSTPQSPAPTVKSSGS